MRDGTVPVVATGRELRGRRTAEHYLLHSRVLASTERRHAIVLELGRVDLRARSSDPRRDGYRASPYHRLCGVKIMQATLRTRAGNGSYFCFRKMRKNLKDNSYWQTG